MSTPPAASRRPRYGAPEPGVGDVLRISRTVADVTAGLELTRVAGRVAARLLDDEGGVADDRPAAVLVEQIVDLPFIDGHGPHPTVSVLPPHTATGSETVSPSVLASLREFGALPGTGPGAMALARPAAAVEVLLLAADTDGTLERGDLAWVADGDGLLWQVEPAQDGHVTVLPVDETQLRGALGPLTGRFTR